MSANSTIVVGLDGSAASHEALLWAIRQAGARPGALHLVHALPDLAASEESARLADERAEAMLDAAARLATDAGVVIGGKTIAHRPPAPLLLEVADVAGLLVVGSRGRGAQLSRRGDSVGAHVSRFARCSVVVVPPMVKPPSGTLAVHIWGTADDRCALQFAFDYAAVNRCDLEVVHAWQEPELAPSDFSPLAEVRFDTHRRASEILLSEELAGFALSHPDVSVRRASLPTDPRDALLSSSAEADLLVVPAPRPSLQPRSRDLMELAALRHAKSAVAQQNLRSILSFCNSPQMNAPEAYIQFEPGLITDAGEVTDGPTEQFLREFMVEFAQFIARVLTVSPRTR